MKKLSLGVATVALAFLVGCSKGHGNLGDNSPQIIKVNNDVITQKMFDKTFNTAYKSSFLASKNINFKDPKALNDPKVKMFYYMLKNDSINNVIVKDLLQQEAEKRKIQISDKDVDKAFNEMANKLGGKAKLESMLTMNNISMDDYRDNVRMDLLTKKLVEVAVPNSNVSEKDAQTFYNQNKTTKFTFPDLVRAEHILISAPKSEIKAKITAENPNLPKDQVDKKVAAEISKAKTKANDLLAQVTKSPNKFEALAKQYSQDPGSAQKGGDLGFFDQKHMVPAFAKAAFSLTPGKISDVVETDFGFHIIKVVDRKKAGSTPFAEVKNEIVKFLAEQKKVTAFQKILESSRNAAKIVYIDKEYDPKNVQKEFKSFMKVAPAKGKTSVSSADTQGKK